MVTTVRRNGRNDESRIIRSKQRPNLKIQISSAYTEEPWTNDNYFRSKQDDLIGSLGTEKYGGIGEHSSARATVLPTFLGDSCLLGQKQPRQTTGKERIDSWRADERKTPRL